MRIPWRISAAEPVNRMSKNLCYAHRGRIRRPKTHPWMSPIHQLVLGHHQSLLVTRGDKIVGILRLTDVFRRYFPQHERVFREIALL